MSILKVDELQSRTSGNRIALPDVNNYPPYRNLIINGDMSIAQRGTSESGITSNGYYTCDRWQTTIVGGTYTQAQTALTSSDTPFSNGLSNSIKYDCTSTYTSADSLVLLRQIIEGQNLQYLGYGTSSAKSLTLSFWVKSNVTGTAIASLYDGDNVKHQGKTYTINSANTWEKKTLTFSGNTSNTFNNDNLASLYLSFIFSAGTNYTSGTLPSTWTSYSNADLAVGQTIDISANTANEISFTGVQLEVGDSATPFEHLPTDISLQRCQRYFEKYEEATGYFHALRGQTNEASLCFVNVFFKTEMRTDPSITITAESNVTGDQIQGINTKGFVRSGTTTSSTSTARLDGYEADAEL